MKNLSSNKNKLDFLRIYFKNFISLKFPFSLSSSYAYAGSVCLILIFSNFVFAEQKTAGQTINIKTKVYGDVYGNGSQPNGWAMHKLDDANNNVVNVSDDVCREWSRRDEDVSVYGASDSDKATNNSVNIYKGTISGDVYGASAGVNAANNSVKIYGGNISKGVYGGQSDGKATDNSVTITGGNVSGHVHGGNAKINATNNSVTITGGTVSGHVHGGFSEKDNATNNSVTITGGTVSGHVCGGRAGGDSTGNIVRISGNPKFSTGTVICGGAGIVICGGCVTETGNSLTNNRFIIDTKEIEVNGICKFEYYDFYLSKNIEIGNVMLIATDGCGDERCINLEKAKVDVYSTPDKPLNIGDRYTLIKSASYGFSNPQFHKKTHIKQGLGVIYDSYVAVEDNKSLEVTVTGQRKPNPQTKALSQGRLATMSFVEQGSQLIANKAIGEAATSSISNTASYAPFATVAVGKSKYTTGKDSHINIEGISLAAGIAGGFGLGDCNITAGVFAEHGNSKYKSSDAITLEDIKKDIQATGKPQYTGGGLLGRVDFSNGFYTEISGRMGSAKNNFYSDDIKFYNKPTSYNYNRLYLGTHMGGGYNYKINDKLALDTSGKYFFTHQGDKDITLSTDETMKFAGISSHKIRLGPKIIYKITEKLSSYLGATFEYEFAGKQNATLAGFDVNAPTLKSAGAIGELGVKCNVGGFLMDFSLKGYMVGTRTGIDGMLKMKYTFGNQKEVSPVDSKLDASGTPQKVSPSLPKSKETAVDEAINVQSKPKEEIVVDGITYVQSKPKEEIVVDGITYVQKKSSVTPSTYSSKSKEVIVPDRVTYVKSWTYSPIVPDRKPWTYSPLIEVKIKEEPSPKPWKSSRTGERLYGPPILRSQFR